MESSHHHSKLSVNSEDLYFGIGLSVAHFTFGALLSSVGEDGNLLGFSVLQNLSRHGGTLHGGSTDNGLAFFADNRYLIKGDVGVFLGVQLLHEDDVALGHAVLLTAGYDDCVHNMTYLLLRLAVWGRLPKKDALREPGTCGYKIITYLFWTVNGFT